jgi:hypothetical protein
MKIRQLWYKLKNLSIPEMASAKLYIESILIGFIASEIYYFASAAGSAIAAWIIIYLGIDPKLILGVLLALCLVVLIYFLLRGGVSLAKKILMSNHPEVFLIVLFGISISVSFGGFGLENYQIFISKINIPSIALLSIAPFLFVLLFLTNHLLVKKKSKKNVSSIFINDEAISDAGKDILGVNDKAEKFAVSVLNNGSSDSLVFGIDAPWGTGKSSFIYLCCGYWSSIENSKPIVHRFEPVKYIDQTNLAEKLVSELVETIKQEAFIPELDSTLEDYLNLLKGGDNFSIFGFKFSFSSEKKLNNAYERLQKCLNTLNRKIIIIIDDLDRLSWKESKKILFSIKQSFMLKNISYVICYDTDNLSGASKKSHALDIRDFLEKYVNIKISLYTNTEKLSSIVSSDIKLFLGNIISTDVRLFDQLKSSLDYLKSLYQSNEYHYYASFLGELRKVKRLINTMMMFEIEKTDFENSDFHSQDLLNLLIIYINYPNLFRKIYNSETGKKNGVFSLERDEFGSAKKYKNSADFDKTLTDGKHSEQEKYLLKKLFDYKTLKDSIELHDQELNLATRACFNGVSGTTRNLERYLNLIVNLAKPTKSESHTFYLTQKNKFTNGEALSAILSNEEFDLEKGDFSQNELFNTLGNSAYEINSKHADILIRHILNSIYKYSLLDSETLGANSRSNLIYSLLKILDTAGWVSIESRRNNTNENIKGITDWIFGEGAHKHESIIATLVGADRLPIGFYDLLLFRLYCSADRGNSLFNIQRALSLRYSLDAPTQGLTTEIAKQGMRQISQKIFDSFHEQYIKNKINYFDHVKKLELPEIAGKTESFVNLQISKRVISNQEVNDKVEVVKSRILNFTIYQLTNKLVSSGIGCGYYDRTGIQDQSGIFQLMNNYLFKVCFNPRNKEDNYEHFLDYLLLHLSHPFETNEDEFTPRAEELDKTLDREMLKAYWVRNKTKILNKKYHERSKRVFHSNYITSYKEQLVNVFKMLDSLAQTN